MADDVLYLPADFTEDDKVELFRLSTLIEAGYSYEDASRLATCQWFEVDLHMAVELVAKGCDPHTATRILLP